MKRFAAFLLLAVIFGSTQAISLDDYFVKIQVATWVNDYASLAQLSKELNAKAASGGPEVIFVVAYDDYRLAAVGMNDLQHHAGEVNDALDRAQTRLEGLVSQGTLDTSDKAEALALLSSVYGMKIGLNPMKGPILGMKSGHALADAEQLAPNNPRVLLFKGIAKLNTPALFGGSRDEAIAAFDATIKNLSKENFDATNWGLDEAYIWRGIAYSDAGLVELARASYDEALRIAPDNAWAKAQRAQLVAKR
jgi:tetratricopeptide (TPR) repeat protein